MKNILKDIPDNTLLCNINLAGTHDSCACFIDFPYFTKCQSKTIRGQLEIGIRFFDLRVEVEQGKLKTVHAVFDCRKEKTCREKLMFDDVLTDITSFLKENPTETVLLCVKRDDGISPQETYRVFFEEYAKKSSLFFTENRIPTLGEVRGKTVVLNRCHIGEHSEKECGINLTNWPDQGVFHGLPEEEFPILPESAFGYYLQDFYTLPKKKKWKDAVLPTVTNATRYSGIVFNFFSANNIITSPKAYKNYMFKMFRDFPLQNGKKYGWFILDYPEKDIVEKIMQSNFT